jgi:hypothetical protein
LSPRRLTAPFLRGSTAALASDAYQSTATPNHEEGIAGLNFPQLLQFWQ